MKKTCAIVIGLAAFALSSPAANIAWVSFHSAQDGSPSANAALAGFTQAPDIGYTDLLSANGHTVTRFLTQDIADTAAGNALAAVYNTYDLVIISRSVNSGHYAQQPEYTMWNGLTAPVINLSGYILRNNRLGYTTGTAMPDSTNNITLTVNDPSNPIFNGVSLDGVNTTVNDYAGIVGTARGVSVNTDPVAGGGTVLATVGTALDPTFGGMIIGEWQAGSIMNTAVPTTLAGRRLVFLTGSREEAGVSSETAGQFDLTADGTLMFLNAVNYIPEPSSLALIVLGGLPLLLRRKRA